MLLHEFACHQHVFAGADDPLRDKILLFMIAVLTVKLHETLGADAFCQLLGFGFRHVVPLCHFRHSQLDRSLFLKAQHELYFIGRKHFVQQPEIRIVVSDILGFAGQLQIVRDHCGKPADQFFALLIRDFILFGQIVIVIK